MNRNEERDAALEMVPDVQLLTVRRDAETELRVALRRRANRTRIALREFWLSDRGDLYHPSKHGLSLSLAEAEGVATAILRGVALARERARQVKG